MKPGKMYRGDCAYRFAPPLVVSTVHVQVNSLSEFIAQVTSSNKVTVAVRFLEGKLYEEKEDRVMHDKIVVPEALAATALSLEKQL